MRRTELVLSLAGLLGLMALAVPAAAQETLTEVAGDLNVVSAAANVNLIYDDGEADNGWRPAPGTTREFAMRFNAPAAGVLKTVAVCFARNSGDASSGNFKLFIYNSTASGPGSLIYALQGNPSSVPATTTSNIVEDFHTYDISGYNVNVPATFYLGIELKDATSDFFLCTDYDSSQRPIYQSVNSGPWQNFTSIDAMARAFMVRAAVDTGGGGAFTCVEDLYTACVLNDRFKVQVRYRNIFNDGPTNTYGFRKPVTGFASSTYETAFFYFNSINNIEAMVKILDQGNKNGSGQFTIAVLTGTATPLALDVIVTDSWTGQTNVYNSPYGSQAGKTDFRAFLKTP